MGRRYIALDADTALNNNLTCQSPLWDLNAIGRWRWNISTQVREVCDEEIEIISFVVIWNVKLTIPPNRQQ